MALGILVFGWMNAVAQPCLMDMSVTAEMLAPVTHVEHGGHDMNHNTADADCGHCPPGGQRASDDCVTVASAVCDAAADIAVEARTTKLKPGNLPDDAEPIVSIADPPPGQAIYIEYLQACQSQVLPAGPSLNLQYCVFLK